MGSGDMGTTLIEYFGSVVPERTEVLNRGGTHVWSDRSLFALKCDTYCILELQRRRTEVLNKGGTRPPEPMKVLQTWVPPLLSTSVRSGTTLIEYFGSPHLGLKKRIRIIIFLWKCSSIVRHRSGRPPGQTFQGPGGTQKAGTTLSEYFGSPTWEHLGAPKCNTYHHFNTFLRK